jgi:hypothetical protein
LDEDPAKNRPFDEENGNQDEAGAGVKSKARITTQPIFAASPDVADIDALQAKVPPETLGLFIVNSGDLMLVERAEAITLGRQTEDSRTSVSVDLTPYGGKHLGVSRQHAVIRVRQGTYLLQDLGSTNGTYLNEVRVPSHVPRELENGDVIRLGQIRVHVVFND